MSDKVSDGASHTAALTGLVAKLRALPNDAPQVLRASIALMKTDEEYREAMIVSVRSLLDGTNATHLLTEGAILSDEGIMSGSMRRIGGYVAPAPARGNALDLRAAGLLRAKDRAWLDALSRGDVEAWISELLTYGPSSDTSEEVASALIILATRVAGAGLDARLSARVPSLERWGAPFIELVRVVEHFTDAYLSDTADIDEARAAASRGVAECQRQVRRLRSVAESVGTTLHISSNSLRMQQQLERMQTLLNTSDTEGGHAALAGLVLRLCRDAVEPHQTLRFVQRKLDLLSFLAIGHAAQAGVKYAARTVAEYRSFIRKSLFGGFLVAIFGSLKLFLPVENFAPFSKAITYGANYAVCFALIYLLGATLATKQPAFTASLLASSLKNDEESFPLLVRDIWRSQFVSFLGNMSAAGLFGVLFAVAFEAMTGQTYLTQEKAAYLAHGLHPLHSPALYYAAVAGVLLSVAGFISGFADNWMVFHRVQDRVLCGRGVFRFFPMKFRSWAAPRIQQRAGGLFGNVILGFLLGSAGTLGFIFGIPFDIRHVAFASTHGALAVLYDPSLWTFTGVLTMVVGVSLIGFVNFLVSFALTLSVAIRARHLEGTGLGNNLWAALRLAMKSPRSFFLPPRAALGEVEIEEKPVVPSGVPGTERGTGS